MLKMATDGQVVAAAARWSDEHTYLWQLVQNSSLPAVVKVVKGQYSVIGVPSLPSPGLQTTALIVSHGPRRAIIAQPIKIKEGRRIAAVGPRVVIPENYPGYFELLSEEGRGMRAMESVSEVCRRKPLCLCLVRQAIRALAGRVDNNGSIQSAGSKLIHPGETIFPVGEVHLPQYKTTFLHCIDSRREIVLLGLDQRGRFSAIAKEESISGVHSARNLLTKRMPLTVRLVHGPAPSGLRGQALLFSELRLLAVKHEEALFALPLQKECNGVIPVPLGVPLKFQVARNQETLGKLQELHRLLEKCLKLVMEVADRAHVLDSKISEKMLRLRGLSIEHQHGNRFNHEEPIQRSTSLELTKPITKNDKLSIFSEDYDDIDQIYDYVRGFAPLPKNMKLPFSDPNPHLSKYLPAVKPLPPPIETIPKKFQAPKAEKRSRKDTNISENFGSGESKSSYCERNHYIKNVLPTKSSRVLRQKLSSTSLKNRFIYSESAKNKSLVRYKSLSDLLDNDEYNNTLASSHSGGIGSGDSEQHSLLEKKRIRTLSRPISLTNLVYHDKVIFTKPTSQTGAHVRTLYL